MINHRRAIPKKHMDYQDRLPKRDSLNLVQVPHLVEGNATHARVFPPLLRRLETHRDDPIRERNQKNCLGLIFLKIWTLNGALGQILMREETTCAQPGLRKQVLVQIQRISIASYCLLLIGINHRQDLDWCLARDDLIPTNPIIHKDMFPHAAERQSVSLACKNLNACFFFFFLQMEAGFAEELCQGLGSLNR